MAIKTAHCAAQTLHETQSPFRVKTAAVVDTEYRLSSPIAIGQNQLFRSPSCGVPSTIADWVTKYLGFATRVHEFRHEPQRQYQLDAAALGFWVIHFQHPAHTGH